MMLCAICNMHNPFVDSVICLVGYIITNRSYWKALNGGEIVSVGFHLDTFVQEDSMKGDWLCKKRIIQHVWTKIDGQILDMKGSQ